MYYTEIIEATTDDSDKNYDIEDSETILYETDDFKMGELQGEYSGTPNRFIIFCKKTDSHFYVPPHGFLYSGNYQRVKEKIDELQMVEDLTGVQVKHDQRMEILPLGSPEKV
jgi:hypothetical protein